jgi:hypothetical protein
MAAGRLKARWTPRPTQRQNAILVAGFFVIVAVVLLSPLMMIRLSDRRLPWSQLADIDREQHRELLGLAIDNPELIEVLDARLRRHSAERDP